MSHIDAHAQFQGMPGFILKWLAVFFMKMWQRMFIKSQHIKTYLF